MNRLRLPAGEHISSGRGIALRTDANDRLAAKLWQFAQDDAFPEPAEADADSA